MSEDYGKLPNNFEVRPTVLGFSEIDSILEKVASFDGQVVERKEVNSDILAVHEAGHLIVGKVFGLPGIKLTVEDSMLSVGVSWEKARGVKKKDYIAFILGGIAAEMLYDGQIMRRSEGYRNDIEALVEVGLDDSGIERAMQSAMLLIYKNRASFAEIKKNVKDCLESRTEGVYDLDENKLVRKG